jgi:uncharacterized protein YjiS (DUF1127 family)
MSQHEGLRERPDWTRGGEESRRRKKERHVASIKFITQKLAARRRYREVVRELSQMSDHELCDIGIHRCDIESIARQTVAA